MTAYSNLLDGTLVDLVKITAKKGGGLEQLTTETFEGYLFQAPDFVDIGNISATVPVSVSGQEKSKDAAKTVRIGKEIAVLGARGDTLEVELQCTVGGGTASYAKAMNMVLFDIEEYIGVPQSVQYAVLGKKSVFVTPSMPVGEGQLKGIARQITEISNNVVMTATATATDQKVRGTSDSRVTATPTGAGTAITKIVITLTPNDGNVFVLPLGGKLWAGVSPKATRAIVAQAA
jgi:hypothetical protein